MLEPLSASLHLSHCASLVSFSTPCHPVVQGASALSSLEAQSAQKKEQLRHIHNLVKDPAAKAKLGLDKYRQVLQS